MDEDFLDVTESGNKKTLIFLLIIVGTILILGYFLVVKKSNFSVKNLDVEINSKLSDDVNFYLNKEVIDTSGYKVKLDNVKIDEVGKYKYTVKYNKKIRKGIINIVDTHAPIFETKELTIEQGDEDFYLGNFLTKCEDSSKPCIVTYKHEKDKEKINEIGKHNFEIVVEDIYKNKETTNVTLNVVEKGSITDENLLDLDFFTSSKPLENFNNEYFIKLDKAIYKDSEDAKKYANELAQLNIETIVKDKYKDYKYISHEIIELYNKASNIIGYTIKLTLNNGSDVIMYLTK